MLSKRKRLRRQEVQEILASGRSLREGHMQMKFITTSQPLRAAVVVSKALARKAHERGTLRRAAYRALMSGTLPAKKGSAVFFVRSIPRDKKTPAFLLDVSALLKKLP